MLKLNWKLKHEACLHLAMKGFASRDGDGADL